MQKLTRIKNKYTYGSQLFFLRLRYLADCGIKSWVLGGYNMGRPKSHYIIDCDPGYGSFKPQGCECIEYVEITPEEVESLRLKNIKNLDQTEAAKQMGVSQSTFQRILSSAYKKVSETIINGKELRIIHK